MTPELERDLAQEARRWGRFITGNLSHALAESGWNNLGGAMRRSNSPCPGCGQIEDHDYGCPVGLGGDALEAKP